MDDHGRPRVLLLSAGNTNDITMAHALIEAAGPFRKLLAEIREFGGDMKETYGVPVEEIQTAIKFGVRKINIDTDIRLAMTGAIRRFFAEHPSKFDPREYLKPAKAAAKAIVKARYEQFNCAGQASKIKALDLTAVALAYKDGKLTQVVN